MPVPGKKTTAFILIILFLTTTGCIFMDGFLLLTGVKSSGRIDNNQIPTSIKPIKQTSTTTLTPSPATTSTPIPATLTPTPSKFMEGGVDVIPQQEGQVNFLILGSDYRAGGGYRTDIILLVNLNPATGLGSVISFPRDLYLDLPGWGFERINTAMEFGGFELLQSSFEYHFGIHPDFYVITNFTGLTSIVDTLGGIDVNAANTLSDWCDLPSGIKGTCTIPAGWNHLNGEMALWYARSRYSTSDFDRGRRAQELAAAFFNRLMEFEALTKAPELYQLLQNSVETNVTIDDILPLLPLAAEITKDGHFRQFVIGPDQVTVWIPPSGAYLLLPNPEAFRDLLVQALTN